jgi:hypothetical protein
MPIFIHHLAVTSKNVTLFRQILADYMRDHPGVITRHGVGFLGKNYLVQATEDIAEVFQKTGIACRVTEV